MKKYFMYILFLLLNIFAYSFTANTKEIPLYKMGDNDCAAFCITAIINSQVDNFINPSEIKKEIKVKGNVFPKEIKRIFKLKGYKAKFRIIFKHFRIRYVKHQLYNKKPVMVVVLLPDGRLHWVVIMGIDKGGVNIYDPLYFAKNKEYTIDNNGNAPGNMTMSEWKFLEWWDSGKFLGVGGFAISLK